jgi:RNA-directed DNA polymerase
VKVDELQEKPAGVPVEKPAKQDGGIRARWAWVKATVWTERMLTALENGVKGNVWYALYDKIRDLRNLTDAWESVRRNRGAGGVDNETTQKFEKQADEKLAKLQEELKGKTYRPQAVQRVFIPKPGSDQKRPLGIPTVRDRIVQGALRNVVEPIFERDFSAHSYGFRPGRGCKDALREINGLLMDGYTHIVDADIKGYFDNIPHGRLMERIEMKIADGAVLGLIRSYLKQGVLEEMKYWEPEKGTPQGAVISPLLANIYLDPLDHEMEQRGYRMVRYADDFVVLCRNEEEARTALSSVEKWMTKNELNLHPDKTKLVDVGRIGEGFDFLGYHFGRGRNSGKIRRWPAKKSWQKMTMTIREKTRRANGKSLPDIIKEVNLTLRGWFEYFKHSNRFTHKKVDGWVRMRLRSILRKRSGRRGRGRGSDHQRWPNDFFAKHGLFSLIAAYEMACQSV